MPTAIRASVSVRASSSKRPVPAQRGERELPPAAPSSVGRRSPARSGERGLPISFKATSARKSCALDRGRSPDGPHPRGHSRTVASPGERARVPGPQSRVGSPLVDAGWHHFGRLARPQQSSDRALRLSRCCCGRHRVPLAEHAPEDRSCGRSESFRQPESARVRWCSPSSWESGVGCCSTWSAWRLSSHTASR